MTHLLDPKHPLAITNPAVKVFRFAQLLFICYIGCCSIHINLFSYKYLKTQYIFSYLGPQNSFSQICSQSFTFRLMLCLHIPPCPLSDLTLPMSLHQPLLSLLDFMLEPCWPHASIPAGTSHLLFLLMKYSSSLPIYPLSPPTPSGFDALFITLENLFLLSYFIHFPLHPTFSEE